MSLPLKRLAEHISTIELTRKQDVPGLQVSFTNCEYKSDVCIFGLVLLSGPSRNTIYFEY